MSLWSLINSVIITSIAEEIIFRGLLTDILGVCNSQSKLGIISGILLTAIVWALSHLHGINIPTLLLIFDGIIIGLIYYYYKNLIYSAKVQKRKDNTERKRTILLLFITYYHPDTPFSVVFLFFKLFLTKKQKHSYFNKSAKAAS